MVRYCKRGENFTGRMDLELAVFSILMQLGDCLKMSFSVKYHIRYYQL